MKHAKVRQFTIAYVHHVFVPFVYFTNLFFCYRKIVELSSVPSSTDAKHATIMCAVGHSGYRVSVDGSCDLLTMKFEYNPMPLVRGERHVSRSKRAGHKFVSGRRQRPGSV